MKKFGRKTTLNLRYGSDKGSHSVVSDWKGLGFFKTWIVIGILKTIRTSFARTAEKDKGGVVDG